MTFLIERKLIVSKSYDKHRYSAQLEEWEIYSFLKLIELCCHGLTTSNQRLVGLAMEKVRENETKA